jgi:hypothetical protein
MTQSRFCASCGVQVGEGDRFCKSCGTALDPPEAETELTSAQFAPPQAPPASPPPGPPPGSGQGDSSPGPGNRRRVVVAAAVGTLAVAGIALAVILGSGGGGTDSNTEADVGSETGSAAPEPATTAEAPPPPAPDPNACDTKGIVPLDPSTAAGKCKSGGTRFTVANQDGVLKTKTLVARLSGSRQATSLSDPDGFETTTANGTYLVLTVDLTNKLDSPVDIASDQTALILTSGKQYQEDFDAENGADQQSFLWQLDNGLQPDETRTGDFVFDLPPKAIRRFQNDGGALAIAELGDDISDTKRVGVIRLSAP